MAKAAGCYQLAEHYLMSLMVHALLNGKSYMVDRVNEVRAYYQVAPIPADQLQTDCTEPPSSPRASIDVQARRVYKSMTKDAQTKVLTMGLRLLHADYAELFQQKIDWMGIYLVIHDRLDGMMTQQSFYDIANSMTPEDFPVRLRIGKTTLKNYGRYVNYEDRIQAYYDMERNPWSKLCDTFWIILRGLLLTESRRQKTARDGI